MAICKFNNVKTGQRCDEKVSASNTFCDAHRDTLCARLFAPHIADIKDYGRFYFVMDRYQMRINDQGVLVPISNYDISMLRKCGLQAGHSIMDMNTK